jgi:hypothetical protein
MRGLGGAAAFSAMRNYNRTLAIDDENLQIQRLRRVPVEVLF